MARIAIILANDFEDPELFEPRAALADRGHDVEIIGERAGTELRGKRGGTVVTDSSIDGADPREYDALVIPGGYSPDHLRLNGAMVSFTKDMGTRGGPVAAICHAGWMLIEAGLARGRTVTSWPSVRTDLINAGAHWVDQEVVVENNIITARNPDDIPAFNAAILKALEMAQADSTAPFMNTKGSAS